MKSNKICILGAAGSIGSRLVTLLNEQGYQVTAVVRSLSSAVRIGRLDISIIPMDVLTASKSDLSDVLKGHDVVVDCTYSTNPDYDTRIQESKDIAKLICDASLDAKVTRLIHYGTISVYPAHGGAVSEATLCEMTGDAYGDSKFAAEIAFLERNSKDLSVTVLQLPIVFGPYMGWTCSPVVQMSNQQLLMPNDLTGKCSPLFVDDVAYATMAAFDCEASYGERILLSDESLSWEGYYSVYSELSEMLSFSCIDRGEFKQQRDSDLYLNEPFQKLKSAFMDDGDFRQLILAQWGVRHLYALVKKRRGQTGMDQIKGKIQASVKSKNIDAEAQKKVLLGENLVTLFDSLPQIKSSKAKEILGFEPQVDFSTAIGITHEWLKWARLVK